MKFKKTLSVLSLYSVSFLSFALAEPQFCVKVSENISLCAQVDTQESAINLLTTSLQSSDTMITLYKTALKELENRNIASTDQQLMLVNREQVNCEGIVPMKCLQVKYSLDQPEWENFYSNIQGFEFEEGNHYLLRVKKTMIENPAADASSIRYELIEVLDKI